MDLTGRVVLITGASMGIGAALARALARKKARLALMARSTDKLEKLAKELKNDGADVITITADVTQQEDVQRTIDVTCKHFGRLDAVVNNAGLGLYGALEHVPLGEFERVLRVNVLGPHMVMREAIPIMRKQHGGIIVNVSSMVSKNYYPYLGAYAATKYALNALSHTARAELQGDGILVCVVCPGLTDTDFGKHAVKVDSMGRSLEERTRPPAPHAESAEQVAERIIRALESGEAEMY